MPVFGLLDENVAVVLECVAKESDFFVVCAITLIFQATFFLVGVWNTTWNLMI